MLINGKLGQKFRIQKGVRQGDPLSPYLFNLMGDVLQQMIRVAYDNNYFTHPIQQGAPLPVLQYADDTLLILHGSTQQATALKFLLDTFAAFSGLQINYQKSTLVPIHVDAHTAAGISAILGCPLSGLPCTYLGLPLSMNKIGRALLQPVLSRVDRRLPGWVPQLLSSSARVTLINSVLSAIPNFFMACIQWDKGSIEAIDKLRRAFLWNNGEKANEI